MIEVDNVQKSFKDTVALSGISLEVKNGEVVILAGPNGSGKTTLLQSIAGLVKLDEGEIKVNGVNVTSASEGKIRRFRRDKVGYIFQSVTLTPNLSALENILLPTIFSKRDREDEALSLLKRLGIEEKKDKSARTLSGGQKRRVMIIRSLINDPEVILADEPTSDLDVEGTEQMMDLLEEKSESGTTVLVATNDERMMKGKGRIVNIRGGKREQ